MMTLSFFAACCASVVALYNPNPWQEVSSQDDLRVWARQVPDSNIREVRAEAVIDAPITRIWDVLEDVDSYVTFMPYVVESRTLERAEAGPYLEYFRVNPPLVSARDYTLKVHVSQDHPKGEFIRRWSLARDKGPPPRQDSIRLQICDGSWTLQRLAEDKTRVVYWVYTDPAGSIPGWLANQANTRSVPDVMNAVRHKALNRNFTR